MVDGKCKLLLIREETGYPSKQLCQWADVLLLVFSYSNEDSLFQVCGLGGEERSGREEGWRKREGWEGGREEKREVGGRKGGEERGERERGWRKRGERETGGTRKECR